MAALLGPQKGLEDERRHAMKVLPNGIRRELWHAVASQELAAAERASAIGVGLCASRLGLRRASGPATNPPTIGCQLCGAGLFAAGTGTAGACLVKSPGRYWTAGNGGAGSERHLS